ncbi:MAG TPA: SDR family oxidoreductase [Streptosporangiaceae bacterium]|jgi:NAD(P)-dependent dehydrogenase (short-subunit alcohol dehydrogenase family)|nr:SDR family oxidoreductase [Streptosporangiaceae bacterium]
MEQKTDNLAVVFGAAGGIARELAKLLAGKGMRLALVDIDEERLADARAAIGDRVAGCYRADVTAEPHLPPLAERIGIECGPSSLLIISVGWLGPLGRTSWEYSRDEWERVFAVNLFGPISCVRAFLPSMEAAGGDRRIVILSSLGAMYASPRLGAYAAAKRALVSFAETLQLELAERGAEIGVSVVCPGSVPTELNLPLRQARGELRPASGEWLEAPEVAQRIVESLDSGQFYVFTHPSSRSRYESYRDRIMAAF